MAFANVNIGSTADDGTGDPLRTAFTKINLNFANIASGSAPLTAPVQSVAGRTGNIALTISDVSGAVPYGYVNSGLIGANTYTNTAVANITTTVYNQVAANLATNISNIIIAQVTANINSTVLAPVNANVTAANAHIAILDANLGVATTNISTLQVYVNTLQNNTASLFSNTISQQSDIRVLQANIADANTAIVVANTATTAYINDQISSVNTAWTANAVTQLAQITAANTAIVTANTAVVAYVNTLNSAMAANVGGANNAIVTANSALKSYTDTQLATANTQLRAYTDSQVYSSNSSMTVYVDARDSAITAAWTANAATQAGNLATLFANAAAQSDAISGANTAIVTANTAVVAYVNTLNSAMSSNIIAANSAISGANTAIVTANTAMKVYVDSLNVAMAANVSGANSAIVTANTALKNYVDLVNAADTQNWQSATGLLTSQINAANLSIAGANAAIVTANTAMKGYVDQINATDTQNWQSTTGVLNSQIAAANVHIQTLDANVGSFYTYANIYFGVSGYSNLTVASYLPVYSGNISATYITPTGTTGTGFKPITAGLQSGYAVVPYYLAQFTTNSNSYSQLNIQNINRGNQSTTDYVATANNGSDTTYFVNLGIAGNLYNGLNPNNSLGTVLNINDAYLYAQGNVTSGSPGGNLVIGTTTPGTSIRFIGGGPNAANVAVTINNPGTDAINNTSGALVVNGGMGVLGNINVGSYNYSLHTIRGNLLLGLGNVVSSADSILTLNGSTDNPQSSSALLHISGVSNLQAVLGIDSFGNTVSTGVNLRHARGNTSVPLTVQSGDRLGYFQAKGYVSASLGFGTQLGSGLFVYADESYTDTSTAAYVTINTIKTGTNASVTSMRIGSEGNVVIPATTLSSNINTGALVVKGGVGVNGNVTVGTNVYALNYLFANGVNILSTVTSGSGSYSNTNAAAYLTTATISTTGNITAANVLSNNHLFANGVNILTGVTYNYSNTNVASYLTANPQSGTYSNTNVASYLTTATVTTSGNITAGNLIGTHYGNVIGATATHTGNVTVNGVTSLTGNLAVDGGQVTIYDSILDLHTYGNLSPWATDDGRDIGLRMHYFNGVDSLAFLGLENTTRTLQYLINATETNSNVTGTFGNAQLGSLVLSNTTASTGTTIGTAGALYVAGGAGVVGNLNIGGATTHTGTTTHVGNIFQQGQYYETYSNVTNAGGNLTLNFVNGGVYYATLTANVTANIINISNTAFTTAGFTVIVDQGATPYRIANIQFAGGTVNSIKWAGATVPTGTASNTDVISISLINLNNGSYRILGQQSNYA